MRLQIVSDLHLETEPFEVTAAPQADVLVLAGDIDRQWQGLSAFAGWPVPVVFVPGNHEFDRRDVDVAADKLRLLCQGLGLHYLERDSLVLQDGTGRRIRFCGTTRWSDFELFGATGMARALKAGTYFQKVMGATRHGATFDAPAVRELGLECRRWLGQTLAEPAHGRWDATVAITHFDPSLRSGDPRYGQQPTTASFCNADDELLPLADLWIHGHVHVRCDYTVPRIGQAPTRVVCQARGLDDKGESAGFDPLRIYEI